ncbi:MAG: FeoB-associated Cys-rich membrane protein [Lachnospiraceae bacterium]|nr:FeoB-associated Cys-rich membrane protein [Lachnospiraceae bacterium]RKI30159.1 FeoB-associated Cys-rich membrane protein [bacterium D16-36]RKI67737.1 FeoB-associated Cys-rich membrane protein [bacterium 1xD8-6]
MENVIIIVILACIIGYGVYYLYKAKKGGAACIGCPASGKCTGKCNCCEKAEKE